jgi:hypothetical protein
LRHDLPLAREELLPRAMQRDESRVERWDKEPLSLAFEQAEPSSLTDASPMLKATSTPKVARNHSAIRPERSSAVGAAEAVRRK